MPCTDALTGVNNISHVMFTLPSSGEKYVPWNVFFWYSFTSLGFVWLCFLWKMHILLCVCFREGKVRQTGTFKSWGSSFHSCRLTNSLVILHPLRLKLSNGKWTKAYWMQWETQWSRTKRRLRYSIPSLTQSLVVAPVVHWMPSPLNRKTGTGSRMKPPCRSNWENWRCVARRKGERTTY